MSRTHSIPTPLRRAAVLALLATTAAARAADFPEVEPNSTLLTGTVVAGLVDGDRLTGTSTGSSNLGGSSATQDFFRFSLAPRPFGIYRHQLELFTMGSTQHTANLWGYFHAFGAVDPPSDTSVQQLAGTILAARYNAWYSFGGDAPVFYRVSGTANTTNPYFATLSTTAVAYDELGDFASGQITISTIGRGHSTNTDLWVFDENGDAVPGFGNDDEGPGGATTQSRLERAFARGVYYLAISSSNLATNLANPDDDDVRMGPVMPSPGAVARSDLSWPLPLNFAVTDANGTRSFVATKPAAWGVYWARFVVLGGCDPAERGDANCDVGVDFDDIECFVAALIGEAAWDACGHGAECGYVCANDVNGDGLVTFDDIDAFVVCLIAGGCAM